MAAHVLEHGLSSASLRPLARAAGTSDRMLIYHFGSKEGLVEALLAFAAARLAGVLEEALPSTPPDTLPEAVSALVTALRTPPGPAYLRLWLDIAAAAAYGAGPQARAGHQIAEGFLAWVMERLPPGVDDPRSTAAMVLALLDGMALLDAVGRRDLSDAALNGWLGMLTRVEG